jgi:hypothetical protein
MQGLYSFNMWQPTQRAGADELADIPNNLKRLKTI